MRVRFFFCLPFFTVYAHAADPTAIGFVVRRDIVTLLGQWSEAKGWQAADVMRHLPEPQDPLTLYGPGGRVESVVIDDLARSSKRRSPWDWTGHVSRWSWTEAQFYSLAVAGPHPELPRTPEALSVEQAAPAAKEVLRRCGLNVEAPKITFSEAIDVDGDGVVDWLITAHPETASLQDKTSALIYAVAFIKDGKTGEIQILEKYCIKKPAEEPLDELWRRFGAFPYYRIAALSDIDGDGRFEITTYALAQGDTQINFFTLKGKTWSKTLSAWIGY